MRFQSSFLYRSALSALTFFSALFGSEAFASSDTNCYRFEIPDSPDRTLLAGPSETETWCYQKIQSPSGSYFIFNADLSVAKPELALIVEPDGTLIHGSLTSGLLTVHRVQSSQFNPFPIPLEEPDRATARAVPFNSALESSAQQVLEFLLTRPPRSANLAIETGRHLAQVPEQRLPWRGYWWPYKNQPLSGKSDSPMAKLDSFVQARTGSNPGAQAWENKMHRYQGISWEGHCNGWVASAIIRSEPKFARKDTRSGVVFSVADQKGLLAEKDYCVKTAFFGKRYRGRPGDDLKDIYPIDFHQTLSYYIGVLGKPVALDHETGVSVDNHIISGYTMKIKKTGSTTYSVSTKLTIHKYDGSSRYSPGVAPTYKRTFKYSLETDANGALIGGKWKSSGNPDFLWVPLSPSKCRKNNPSVTEQWINEITNLPKAN